MGQITIAITKRVAFRDWTQEFANVYTYTSSAANPDQAGASDLIDELVTFEKTIHGSDVTFVIGRCWSSGGSISSNVMLDEHNLSGTGSRGTHSGLDRERALLVQVPCGIDSRGHTIRLKKWYHTCGAPTGVTFTSTILENKGSIDPTSRANFANAVATGILQIGPSNQWLLSSNAGRQFNDEVTCHRYLEHHQLGDQWR